MSRPRSYLFICFLLICGTLFSQRQADSLLQLLQNASHDTDKMVLNRKLGSYYGVSDPPKAIDYYKVALDLARKTGKKVSEARILNALGGLSYYNGNYKAALEYAIAGEKIWEELKDKDGLAASYNGISLIYSQNNQYKEALQYLKKALALRVELNDTASIGQSYNNLGGYYEDTENYDSCLYYYNLSLKYLKLSGDKLGEARLLNNIGVVNAKKGNYKLAEAHYRQSLAIKEELDDPVGLSEGYLNLGDLYLAMRSYKPAEAYHLKALEAAKSAEALDLQRDAYQSLALINKATGNINAAYEYLVLYMRYKDSVSTEERTRAITEMNARFNSEKKEKEIALLNKDKETQAALSAGEHKRKNTILIAVGAVLLLVVVFSIFLFNRFKITQRQKNIIEKQKLLVEEKQKEILDSIHYARRIQRSLLTSEKYITRVLDKLKR